MQSYNNELVKCIEDLCARRDELHKQILEEEEEKTKVQFDIQLLTEKLAKVNESLSKKTASRAEFDRTIAETEAAYTKILESSQTLLSVLKSTTRGVGVGTTSSRPSQHISLSNNMAAATGPTSSWSHVGQ